MKWRFYLPMWAGAALNVALMLCFWGGPFVWANALVAGVLIGASGVMFAVDITELS